MGFLKDLGGLAGIAAGVYLGGTIGLVGSVVGSESLENLGRQVYDASERAGEVLGDIAENITGEVATSIKTVAQQSTMQSSITDSQMEQKANQIIDDFMMDD
ncbi:hypothetical protein N510_003465 [Firmicutes bacterium ASF500]|nr:hypothetical protein N510_003465 [Firmicutes bacterium ASF500]